MVVNDGGCTVEKRFKNSASELGGFPNVEVSKGGGCLKVPGGSKGVIKLLVVAFH